MQFTSRARRSGTVLDEFFGVGGAGTWLGSTDLVIDNIEKFVFGSERYNENA